MYSKQFFEVIQSYVLLYIAETVNISDIVLFKKDGSQIIEKDRKFSNIIIYNEQA